MTRLRFLLSVLMLACLALSSCKGNGNKSDAIVAEGVLPAVKDDAKGQSYTYVDDKGDFHVADTVNEVPVTWRAFVRVMDAEHDAPEGSVFVADLTQKKPDGTYAVRVVPRQELDDIALARRKTVGPTIAMNGQVASADAKDGGAPGVSADNAAPRVIIYGASWCGACHEAAAYLKKKNVRFIEKDIEKDAGAEREMNAKLAKSGLRGGGIPVIDVGGKIMVGFSAPKMDAALGETI